MKTEYCDRCGMPPVYGLLRCDNCLEYLCETCFGRGGGGYICKHCRYEKYINDMGQEDRGEEDRGEDPENDSQKQKED